MSNRLGKSLLPEVFTTFSANQIIMNKYFLVLLLTIFIVSCESSKNNTNKPTNNATKDTVIAVRDTVRISLVSGLIFTTTKVV